MNLPHHRTEFHTVPVPMVIDGKVTQFLRDADNNLVCPISRCGKRYSRRSNYLRHLREHGFNSTTPQSNGKRALSASLENLTENVRKKTKVAVEKFGKAVKSKLSPNPLGDHSADFWFRGSTASEENDRQVFRSSYYSLEFSRISKFPSKLSMSSWREGYYDRCLSDGSNLR